MEFYFLPEKNELLKKERGVSFEEAINAILSDNHFFGEIENPNPRKYKGQRAFLVDLNDYIHVVPFEIIDKKFRLKTIIPNSEYNAKLKRGKK